MNKINNFSSMNKINILVYECCGIHAKTDALIPHVYMNDTISDDIGKIFKNGLTVKCNIDDPRFIVYTRVNGSIEHLRSSIISKCLRGK